MSCLFRRFKLVSTALLLSLVVIALPLQSYALTGGTVNVELQQDAQSNSIFWTTPVDYIALGDSLAAGMDFNGAMGKGYPDYLAEEIQLAGYLQSYSKLFSYPGYTAAKVLDDIEKNVSRTIDGVPVTIHDAIKSAELITLSAGANDVLSLIEINNETGAIKFDQAELAAAVQQVGLNTMKIIGTIHALNPDAQVYVMGYYNPFPQLPSHLQPILGQLVDNINLAIGMATDNPTVHFVETSKAIAEDPIVYLPNAANIHLSEAGYRKVTEQFWNEMKTSYSWTPTDRLTARLVGTNQVVLNWKPAVNATAIVSYDLYNGANKITTVAGDVLTYKVENLEKNKQYTFSVSATNEKGETSPHSPTVEVTTGEIPPLLSDIKGHGAQESIEKAVLTGLLKGHVDGTFKPENKLTRAQAASVIVRALKLSTDEVAPFKDIDSYAAETKAEINAAYKYGLVKGSNGNFIPSKVVTRAQLALMIDRAYTVASGKKYIVSSKAPYTDFGNADAETVNAISALYELGIATGSNGKYNPSGSTTRAHAAKMFVNFSSLK